MRRDIVAINKATLPKIRNLLTLRYDPTQTAVSLPKLTWPDFVEYESISSILQPLLVSVIRRIVQTIRPERIAIGISGGVDSTTVLALARKCFPDVEIRSYCVTFGSDTKELEHAEQVAELYRTDHEHVCIEDPFSSLEQQVRIVNEPRWNLYPYFLFKRVAEDSCDLLLTGDGGDELFGGYTFRYRKFLRNCPEDPLDRVKAYVGTHERDWVPDQAELLTSFSWSDIYEELLPHFDNPLQPLGQVFLADYNGKLLHDFVPTNAAFSRHFGVRAESPFLQPEVLHIATHLPYSSKYDSANDVGKLVLRSILLENFGYQVLTKAKIGWGMNLAEMWDKSLKDRCTDSLSQSSKCVEWGIVRSEWLESGFGKADRHDLRYIGKMLGLLALEVWLQQQATIS